MAASQSTTVPPPTAEYGGDEISALILDCGYSTTRAGFAGEDVPKSVIPTHFGYLPSADEGGVPKLLFGDNSIHSPLPRLEIRNPVSSEGVVEDWETATKLWEYAITSRLTNTRPANPATNGLNDPSNEDMEAEMEGLEEREKPLEEHPLLMTEPGWATGKSREKGIQIAMEEWGCPAFWLARSGVLVAFAGGKASSLVIDVGASQVSVTPVHDGLILKKGVQKSPLAGNFISQQIRLLFAQSASPVPLHPYYMVTSKSAVDAGAPSSASYRTFKPASSAPHPSFRLQEEERVLTEFKESVVQVWSGPGRLGATDDAVARSSPGRPFEMPDGWNQVFGTDRFQVVEGMFDAKAALTDADHPAPLPSQTIPALITAAIAAVDVDVRPHLLNNVIVTGGSSLLYGFTERLNQELTTLFPGPRVRMSAPGNTSERRFASWIGGSILGSLGTFHQMWISKREYEEHGAGVVERRCK